MTDAERAALIAGIKDIIKLADDVLKEEGPIVNFQGEAIQDVICIQQIAEDLLASLEVQS